MQRLLPKAISESSVLSGYSLDNLYIDFPFLNSSYDKLFSYILFSLILVSFFLILSFLTRHLPSFNKLELNFSQFNPVKDFTAFSLYERGFTLIELLVVIAIIAVLAVMAFAAFSGLTARGNDDRRRVDIKAIGDAYEVKRLPTAADYGLEALAGTDFAGGVIPADPVSGRQYCIRTGTAAILNAGVSTTDGITSAGACVGTNWLPVSGTGLAAGTTFWKVCTLLTDSTPVCVGSKQ